MQAKSFHRPLVGVGKRAAPTDSERGWGVFRIISNAPWCAGSRGQNNANCFVAPFWAGAGLPTTRRTRDGASGFVTRERPQGVLVVGCGQDFLFLCEDFALRVSPGGAPLGGWIVEK
jgi:hypothetical protein